MKSKYDAVDSVAIMEVICTKTIIPNMDKGGMRIVLSQYWAKNGALLAENIFPDPDSDDEPWER